MLDAVPDVPVPGPAPQGTPEADDAPPSAPVRILAVCLGNVCRSPAAEAMIRAEAATAGVPVEVDSAGTTVPRPGRRANRRMRRAAAGRGLELTSRTRELVADDLDAFDLVVVMDTHNLAAVAALKATHRGRATVRLLRDFDPGATGREIPDPFRAPLAFHESVLGAMAPAVRGVVAWADDARSSSTAAVPLPARTGRLDTAAARVA